MPLDAAFAHLWRKTYARMPPDVGVCAGLVADVRIGQGGSSYPSRAVTRCSLRSVAERCC